MAGMEMAALIALAKDALSGDPLTASRLAAELRERFPRDPAGYRIGAVSARALKHFGEAEGHLVEGAERFPRLAWPVVERALLARARADWSTATDLAAELRQNFPEEESGYSVGAAGARACGRFEEAAEILKVALLRFPERAWPLVEMTLLAQASGDLAEASQLSQKLRDRFPEASQGYRLGAIVARMSERFDQAAQIAAAGLDRFPTEAWPLVETALSQAARGDVDAAFQLTAQLRDRFPEDPAGFKIGASILRGQNRLAHAEALLADAAKRFPEEEWPGAMAAEATRLRIHRAATSRVIDALHGDSATREARKGGRPVTGRVIVVLGMHRSGTSLCAKVLQGLGYALGRPLSGSNFANPDGFFEHKEIVARHVALLEALDATWDTARLIKPLPEGFWLTEAVAAAAERLKRIVVSQVGAGNGTWAFKDPRTARFLPLWKSIFEDLGIQPIWLLCVRDPRAVAASLLARDGLPLEVGEWLWLEHNLDALRHLGPEIAAIINYEKWFDPDSSQLRDLVASVGGASEPSLLAAAGSIRGDLRHNKPTTGAFAMEFARQSHSRLTRDAPDLTRLQVEAEVMWRGLEAFARDRQRDGGAIVGP